MTLPNFNTLSAFFGFRGERHKAYLKVQPQGGDYGMVGFGENDIDTNNNAIAYILGVAPVNPSTGMPVNPVAPFQGMPLGYQQISAATLQSATLLTVPAGSTYAVITPEGGNVRWRDDGVAPTATVGMPLLVGEHLVYASAGLAALDFIDQDANGILNIVYYK